MTFRDALDLFWTEIWKKRPKSFGWTSTEIKNYIIDNAYKTIQRNLSGISKIGGVSHSAFVDLAKNFYKYFGAPAPTSQSDFNKIHKSLCENFIRDLGLKTATYGIAQKIVNVSFKYLYCIHCKFGSSYGAHFKYCHFILDSYTLDWYYTHICKTKKTAQKKWTSLTSADYQKIEDKIISSLSGSLTFPWGGTSVSLPPDALKAEFIIWELEKRKQAISELKKLIEGFYLSSGLDPYIINEINNNTKLVGWVKELSSKL